MSSIDVMRVVCLMLFMQIFLRFIYITVSYVMCLCVMCVFHQKHTMLMQTQINVEIFLIYDCCHYSLCTPAAIKMT